MLIGERCCERCTELVVALNRFSNTPQIRFEESGAGEQLTKVSRVTKFGVGKAMLAHELDDKFERWANDQI